MTYPLSRETALKQRLSMARPMTSLIDRAINSDGPHLVRLVENWVPSWVDTGHIVTGEDPKVHAVRAIDDLGRLMWLVHHKDKSHAYHSQHDDPFAGMGEAAESRRLRRRVRADWDSVQTLRRDAIAGRKRFRVLITDASHGGLCALGTEWFMRRMRLSHVTELSARKTALLGVADRQVLHVLYAAALREGVLDAPAEPAGVAPAAGI